MDELPREKSLGITFCELLQATDEPDKVKRHEALRRWWDKNVVTITGQTVLDYHMVLATRDRLGMIASVWQSNARKIAARVIEEHGLVQQVPPSEPLPTEYDYFGSFERPWLTPVDCRRDVTWLTRISILKP